MWEEGYWDYNLDGACTDYGGCSFVKVCKAKDPENWLPVYFAPKVWDPLLRKETSVAEYEASWGHVRHPDEPPAPGMPDGSAVSSGLDDELQAMLGGS
jgi:hypothetical protein